MLGTGITREIKRIYYHVPLRFPSTWHTHDCVAISYKLRYRDRGVAWLDNPRQPITYKFLRKSVCDTFSVCSPLTHPPLFLSWHGRSLSPLLRGAGCVDCILCPVGGGLVRISAPPTPALMTFLCPTGRSFAPSACGDTRSRQESYREYQLPEGKEAGCGEHPCTVAASNNCRRVMKRVEASTLLYRCSEQRRLPRYRCRRQHRLQKIPLRECNIVTVAREQQA